MCSICIWLPLTPPSRTDLAKSSSFLTLLLPSIFNRKVLRRWECSCCRWNKVVLMSHGKRGRERKFVVRWRSSLLFFYFKQDSVSLLVWRVDLPTLQNRKVRKSMNSSVFSWELERDTDSLRILFSVFTELTGRTSSYEVSTVELFSSPSFHVNHDFQGKLQTAIWKQGLTWQQVNFGLTWCDLLMVSGLLFFLFGFALSFFWERFVVTSIERWREKVSLYQ